jgi:integrase
VASIRIRGRSDGTTAYNVVYVMDGRQTSVTFDSQAAADEFLGSIKLLGADRAMKAFGIAPTVRAIKQKPSGVTVADWVATYITSRSGVAKSTIYDYEAILRNDIRPHTIGGIPLELLARGDVVAWVNAMTTSGKTIANKHGLLSAALNAAVRAELIPSNPAVGIRLPRSEKPEMVFLTKEEFAQLQAGFTDWWQPLLEFMVLSGCRFGEISALKPSDVDRQACTVRVARARKRTYEKGAMYEVGPTKTQRSERVINVHRSALDRLDYSGEWLFTTKGGKPVLVTSWRTNVWYKSVKRAQDKHGLLKAPRIHDMRHTCASWMIQAGVPLPVVQAHLGHESIATTVNLYAHIDRTSHASAAELIGAGLYGADAADTPAADLLAGTPDRRAVDLDAGSSEPETSPLL